MRSELRTALAVLATATVLVGSATMALAADGEGVEPDPSLTTTTSSPTSPTPSAIEPTSTATPSTATPSTPEPSATTPEPEPTDTTPTPAPTETSPPVPTGAFVVDDAQVRWGMNDESNNNSFAPGRTNFFSAGKIPDLGAAGTLTESQWRQASGDVAIEKYANGSWTPATWAGLRTTSAGAPMTGTNGPFSNHQVVISGGSGTVDPSTGSASIQWTGSFTSVYYSGYSFFHVTDPRLTVTNGIGTLTATLSGYSSSMEDMTRWEEVAPVRDVVLADLGPVDLAADLGFSVTPAYRGVAVTIPSDHSPQVRSGSAWGSFPQSFIDYQLRSGTGSYWYSSGGSADAHKVALPVTVSYAAGSPVKVAPPKAKTVKTPRIDDDAPDASADPRKNPFVSAGPSLSTPLSLPAPAAGAALQTATGLTQVRPASTVTGVRPDSGSTDDTTAVWLLGAILLAAAGLVALSPFAYSAVHGKR